jgi:hypothetical protein
MSGASPSRFPRPGAGADIIVAGRSAAADLAVDDLYALLTGASAEEWHYKVNRTSPTRLLTSGGWVFKTNLFKRSERRDEVASWLARSVRLSKGLGVWHPSKQWFILRSDGCYWPCSATRRLITLPELEPGAARWFWLSQALPLEARTLVAHRWALDLKFRNFGVDATGRTVYYVDDEVYRPASLRDLLRLRFAVAH